MLHEKLKILIVDDDPFARAMLKLILESGGHAVEVATNGLEALCQYSRNPDVDLILSDMNMPQMDGLELIRKIRERDTDVPVIILTVNKEVATALEAIRRGADDYVLKDENVSDTLIFSIQKVMERSVLQKQNTLLMKELEQKNRELEQICMLDPLTCISNRRCFDGTFIHEWKRSAREGILLSLALIDIDFFKNFNDTYGHLMGDNCLREVAYALNKGLKRPADHLFRYGGEEFAAILPNTDVEGAVTVAEIMRSNVSVLAIPHTGSEVSDRVTVSIGVGSTIPRPNSKASDFISEVDQALYQAKREGRNRVMTRQVS